MMGNYFGGGYGYMGGFGWFSMIIFWGFIILAVVVGVRMLSGGHGHGHGCCGGSQADEAGKVLRERYAKGEITKEQFEQMKKDLSV